MSATDDIAHHLANGGSLTALDSLEIYGTLKLSTPIHILRRRGMDIADEYLVHGRKRFKRYFIEPDRRQEALELIDAWGSADQQGGKAKTSKHGHSTASNGGEGAPCQ